MIDYGHMVNDVSLLQAALVGYQNHLEEINQAIADIRKQLGTRGGKQAKQPGTIGRRKLSSAARGRIAAAQKKRWAKFHKQKKSPKA